ncbi:MAG: hypothetical protein IJU86_03585 [Firmicutes bacterium]|nr:hypothetical protein [Bacillota bacterium]
MEVELIKQNREKQENQEFEYLAKIPILNTISEMKQPNYDLFEDPKKRLNELLKFLFEDSDPYFITGFVKGFIVATFDIKETGFFGFYKLAQKWLDNVQKEDQSPKNEVKLEDPYELAKQLFMEYVNFRKNATNGAKFKDGCGFDKVLYEANIRDLFTDEDLIELGGNEFIRDCYTAIGQSNLLEKYKLNNKSCIQNIDSRTGKELKSNKDVKPNLYKRVDNNLSWTIFKDGKVKNLNEYEISILQKAMQNEGFWKHLGKTELKILPFTGGAALILGLIAAFAFGATGGALLAVILTPIGAGALGIAPSVTPSMRKSAIVDKMIDIDNPNKEFNNKLKQGEEEYRQYKSKNLDFVEFLQSKSEPEKGNDIIKENRIIPKNDEQNEQNEQNKQNKQNHPLKKVDETNQNQNNQGNDKEENEK